MRATLSAAGVTRRRWDVVVVGAGPAGAVSARQLALQGLRVLLVDRQSFPRDKVCGGCLSSRTLRHLDEAGLGDVAGRLGAVPLSTLRLRSAGRRVDLPLPTGASVSRRALDSALLADAVEAGVEFLPGFAARQAPSRNGSRVVVLVGGDVTVEARAAVTVIAAGLRGGAASFDAPRALDAPVRLGAGFMARLGVGPAARIGVSAIIPDAPRTYDPGSIYMAVGRSGYVGAVRLEDDRLNIAAALDPAVVRGLGPGDAVASILRSCGLEPVEARANAGWKGTARLFSRPDRVADERSFSVGDAAGYVEPFTGEGIGWAISSALLATPLVARAARRWDPRLAGEWESLYRRAVRRSQRGCRAVGWLLRRPAATGWALAAVARRPALARPVVRRLHGEGIWQGARS